MNQFSDMYLGSVPEVKSGAWIQEDGQWIPSFYSKNMEKGNLQIKELYELELLDSDFALLKDSDGIENFAQGNTGALVNQTTAIRANDTYQRPQRSQATSVAIEIRICCLYFFIRRFPPVPGPAFSIYWVKKQRFFDL